jgi:hypothetical protein
LWSGININKQVGCKVQRWSGMQRVPKCFEHNLWKFLTTPNV